MIGPMIDQIKGQHLLVFVGVWSLVILTAGVFIGFSLVETDCGTCEASLDDAIDQLHACEQRSLTPDPKACEDERLVEREQCEAKIERIKLLRCRICEVSHDTYPPEPNNAHPAH